MKYAFYLYCRKEDSFQGLRVGSCSTFRNELSEETHELTKQENLLRRGAWAKSSRVREPRRTALPCIRVSDFMAMVLVSRLSGQSF